MLTERVEDDPGFENDDLEPSMDRVVLRGRDRR